MNIAGIQKMTLLDYPGKIACTVFTQGCDFHCPFCHNTSLVTEKGSVCESVRVEDFFAFLEKRKNRLDGVCVTGGEPLLQKDISGFLERIKRMGFLVKLDTNGSFPGRLKNLVSSGLVDYAAMDIKSSFSHYGDAAGIPRLELEPVRESISFLLSGKVEYEFRTTVVKELHNREVLLEAAGEIAGASRYYLQQFVDSGNLIRHGLTAYNAEEMYCLKELVSPYVKFCGVRGV